MTKPQANDQTRCRLRRYFAQLHALNPHTAEISRSDILAAAAEVDPDSFTEFAAHTAALVHKYLASRIKQAENYALERYFEFIDRAGLLLTQATDAHGAATDPGPGENNTGQFALARAYDFTPLEWFRVQTQAQVPQEVQHAVDAAGARNELVDSVLEIAFAALHTIDSDRAFAWELDYLERTAGELDVDVVRDLLRVWQGCRNIPAAALDWANQWSRDENLRRLWPTVCREADRLLRIHALRAWAAATTTRQSSAMHLRTMVQDDSFEDSRLQRWFDAATESMSRRIDAFIRFADSSRRGPGIAYRNAMVSELHALESLVIPLLISADLALRQPAGPYALALNVLGFSRAALESWRSALENRTAAVIRTIFINQLRDAESPIDAIRGFCLGDKLLFNRLCLHLDILTKQFDSIDQRERVVQMLATNYASYRENELIGRELTRRYRRLMRMLHTDNLRRLLTADQFRGLEHSTVLRELTTLAAAARHYLDRRRHPEAPLEEMYTAEIAFCNTVRNSRLHVIAPLADKNSTSPGSP